MRNSTLLPLPFPECESCGRSWGECLHVDCGGGIDVEPFSGRVRCRTCDSSWLVYESSFLCPCGARFLGSDIEEALADLLEYCRSLVYELSVLTSAKERREQLGRDSLRQFLLGLSEGAGRMAALAISIILDRIGAHFGSRPQ